MGPESKDAVVRVLGHIIDELLQLRHAMQDVKSAIEKGTADAAADNNQTNRRVLDLERAHVNLRNKVDGLPQTPAE